MTSHTWHDIQIMNKQIIPPIDDINCPASIATLAQRLPLRCANVDSPTLGRRGFVNWPNGGTPTLAQRCANIGPMLAH